MSWANPTDSIKDGGGYDLSGIEDAEKQLNAGEVDTTGMIDVDPIDIEVVPHDPSQVARTEELEARIVIVTYDEFDNVLRVEIL